VKICDVKLYIIHHLYVNIHAPTSNYADGLIQSLEKHFLICFCNVHNKASRYKAKCPILTFLITHKWFIKWFFKLKWVPKSFIWFILFTYCSIVNLCFMLMFVDQNKPLSLNQIHSILGESMLKLAKKVVRLKSHFKIWQFFTNTQESRLESFLSFILKTSIPTLV